MRRRAASRCFEEEYPDDSRPRAALEAAEKWLREPTVENRQLVEVLELRLWRGKGLGSGQASLAAQACALAARGARHPVSSAMYAVQCERAANGFGHDDYSRKWLYSVLRQIEPHYDRI
jgi:homoserine kinase